MRWVCGGVGGGGLLIGLCSWVYVYGRVQDREWAMFVFVGCGVVAGFGMILGGAFWLLDGFCGVDVVGLVLDVMWWSW